MPISQVLLPISEGFAGRMRSRVSWRIAAIFGVPIFAGVIGFSYFVYKRRCARALSSNAAPLPSTPLEKGVALKNRGNKYFKAGQYAKAIELYDEGLEYCPVDATTERSALYQNRAAAKENIHQYESAILDCDSALQVFPRYLKALSRRAHLHMKLEAWESCLPDVVACCVFEEFKNADTVIRMDQTLKKIGQKKAVEAFENLPHTLPSNAFIHNYLSAFAWNPFEKLSTSPNPNPVSNGSDSEHAVSDSTREELSGATEINGSTTGEEHTSTVADQVRPALTELEQALTLLAKGKYEASMKTATTAVSLFESALSDATTTTVVQSVSHPAEGDDESASQSVNDLSSTNDGDPSIQNPEPDSKVVDPHLFTEDQLAQAKAAHMQAVLLIGTFMALIGRAAEAKRMYQTVIAEGSGATPTVQVNALIKAACMSMSVDQDFAACLYNFQTAQNVCPECPDVYLHRGQINLLADQLDEALPDLNQAVKLKPEFSIAQAQRLYTLYRKALSDANSERVGKRVGEFHKLAQKYPNCLETHTLYAQVLSDRADFDASDAVFAKVLQLAPNSGMAYAHRGLLQLRWKQNREAAHEWFRRGAEADPQCEMVSELLGQLAVEKGDFLEALDHFDMAIRHAKTQTDLIHLFALREGVRAQYDVCEKYNLSVKSLLASLQVQQQQMTGMM